MIKLLILAGLMSVAAPTAVLAQQSSCLPEDDSSISLLSYAQLLATSSDSRIVETRAAYGILPVKVGEVERITDVATCGIARRAYATAYGMPGNGPRVHVVRIGTRFIVVNPDVASDTSEFAPHIVFDDQFNALAFYAA